MVEGVLMSDTPAKEYKPSSQGRTAEDRLDLCSACPLFVRETGVCNPHLWMNPETREVSRRGGPGFRRGCGCLVTRKAHNASSHCHLGIW